MDTPGGYTWISLSRLRELSDEFDIFERSAGAGDARAAEGGPVAAGGAGAGVGGSFSGPPAGGAGSEPRGRAEPAGRAGGAGTGAGGSSSGTPAGGGAGAGGADPESAGGGAGAGGADPESTGGGAGADTKKAAGGRRSEMVLRHAYPPLPVCGERLIWGFPLLEAAEDQRESRLLCREIGGPGFSPEGGGTGDLIREALLLEGRVDRYSPGEQDRILALIERFGESDPPVDGLVQRKGSFRRMVGQYRSLSKHLRLMVDEGWTDLKTAVAVNGLSPAAAVRLQEGAAGLSFSSRRLLLRYLYEASRRREAGENEQLELAGKILASKDPLEAAQALRFPFITDLERRFDGLRQEVLRKSGVELDHPPGFEGEAFTVRFDFRSPVDLERKIGKLKELKERSNELFDLLG
ncbi:MAG: hypothetical protein K9L29_12160 [Spirochaetales bacterium]|nr:hypothetical protein [Spirochaetales bacterium]